MAAAGYKAARHGSLGAETAWTHCDACCMEALGCAKVHRPMPRLLLRPNADQGANILEI